MDKAQLMTKAAMLRRQLGEDSDFPIDVFAMAQDIEGLSLVFYPMSGNLSGMCIKSAEGSRANVIAINSAMTLGRQRFSLAHELYHMYFDAHMTTVCAKKIAGATGVEREADAFASYFLMPPASLQMKLDSLRTPSQPLSMRDVIRLEQYFRVSHQAMLLRLREDGYLTADECAGMQTGVKQAAEVMGYPTALYMPTPEAEQYATYGSYLAQAESALKRELISEGKYEELLLSAFRADLVYGTADEGGEILD